VLGLGAQFVLVVPDERGNSGVFIDVFFKCFAFGEELLFDLLFLPVEVEHSIKSVLARVCLKTLEVLGQHHDSILEALESTSVVDTASLGFG
jgi:hypothetical protein